MNASHNESRKKARELAEKFIKEHFDPEILVSFQYKYHLEELLLTTFNAGATEQRELTARIEDIEKNFISGLPIQPFPEFSVTWPVTD